MKDMLGRNETITVDKALDIVSENLTAKEPRTEEAEIDSSLNRVCASDIAAPEDLPNFTRSTVDGYAVRAEDTFGASDTMPMYLSLSNEIFMGMKADFELQKGMTSKVPTGGMLPGGADSVVMLEHAQAVDDAMIEVLKAVGPWENVIQKGEDVKAGDFVLRMGQRIRPQDIGACAGIGITKITVYQKPTVSIISTGDEIVAASSDPGPGQVRDINSYLLMAMIRSEGAMPVRKGIFKDNYEDIRKAIEGSVMDSDMVLISGGTSVGAKDQIAAIIRDIGSPGVLFHGVSIKPGKPLIGGVINNVPVFGLPGHPAAVGICFEVFIRPLIRRLSGMAERPAEGMRPIVRAKLSRNVSSPQGREDHVRVMIEEREDGLWAVPGMTKSGLISTLVKADGTFIIPMNVNGVEKGEVVEVRLFY